MSCGLYRRYSRGRRFLYEEEVQRLVEGEERVKRKIISTIPVDDSYRGSLAKASNLKETLSTVKQFGSGVCRIEVVQENGLSYDGTGFYFGDGWILTAAHVLRNRDKVNMARFVFFPPEMEISFEARPRRAIVHRLLPAGRRPDYHNRDIALVKLGIQFTYGRKRDDLEEWEIDEQQLLEQFNFFDFSSLVKNTFTPSGDVQFSLRRTDPLTLIHFGGAQNNYKKFEFDIAMYEVLQVHTIQSNQLRFFCWERRIRLPCDPACRRRAVDSGGCVICRCNTWKWGQFNHCRSSIGVEPRGSSTHWSWSGSCRKNVQFQAI